MGKQNIYIKHIRIIFILLAIFFTIIIGFIFFPLDSKFNFFGLIAALAFISFFLGIALIILTIKSDIKCKPRAYLLMTGASIAGILSFSILHNLLYAMEILTTNIPIIPNIFGFIHGFSFIMAVLVCPIGFVIGIIGTITLTLKKTK
ncbi:hypothetical protein KY320_01150 [Candidatus Woesearchaeota archaeon]|nr:hypothetical protein [Candidatus Woesearchaeota archaeon]